MNRKKENTYFLPTKKTNKQTPVLPLRLTGNCSEMEK